MTEPVNSKVSDILKKKGTDVHVIQQDQTVFDAVVKMSDIGVGSLVVMNGEDVGGIVTERDYLRKVIVWGRSSKETKVSEIMSTDIICVKPEDTVEDCMAVMTEKRIRHLPVITDGKLGGIVSVGDLVKQISRDRRVTIKHLTDFIMDRYPA